MPLRLAALLAIALAALAAAAVRVVRRPEPALRVVAALPTAAGVREGSPVDYRGIPVGTVERVSFADSAVVLVLALRRADVPLRSGDLVEVRPIALVGDVAVSIVPGRAAGRPWRAGDTLRAAPAGPGAARRRSR